MNDKDQGIPMWKSKVARNEKGKKINGFSYTLRFQIVSLEHFVEHNPPIPEEWTSMWLWVCTLVKK